MVHETTESLSLVLEGSSGASIAASNYVADVWIADNDDTAAPGTFRFSAPSYGVGEGAGWATITVERTATADSASVTVSTAGGTADGSDYGAVWQTLSFADGQATATVAVPITDDTLVEGDEAFSLRLGAPSAGYALDPGLASATVTIADNDGASAGGMFRCASPAY